MKENTNNALSKLSQRTFAANFLFAFACGTVSLGVALAALTRGFGIVSKCLGALSLTSGCTGFFLSGIARSSLMPVAAQERLDRLVPPNPDILYSVIIPTFDRANELISLLETIEVMMLRYGDGAGEIVVVDDGSRDDTLPRADTFASRARVPVRLISQNNAGPAAARNIGVQHARGAVAIAIDSDCKPEDTWLVEMLASWKLCPQALVFGRVYSNRRPIFPIEQSPAGMRFVTATFAMLVEEYLGLGGLDPDFRVILEDREFSLRTLANNIPITRSEKAAVWHPIRTVPLRDIWRFSQGNRFDNLLARKHGSSALPFLGNKYYGGSLFGNFPTSVWAISLCTALILSWLSKSFVTNVDATRENQALSIIIVASIAAYMSFACVAAMYLGLKPLQLPRYLTSLSFFAFGSTLARVRGSLQYRLILV